MMSEYEYSDYADPREVERVIHAIERRGRVEKDQKRIGWGLLLTGVGFASALWWFAGPLVGGAAVGAAGLIVAAVKARRDVRRRR